MREETWQDWTEKKETKSDLNIFMSSGCDVARPLDDQGSGSRPFLPSPLAP
jgi:hypothetical protein